MAGSDSIGQVDVFDRNAAPQQYGANQKTISAFSRGKKGKKLMRSGETLIPHSGDQQLSVRRL
jgi:hypothetical protein